MIKITRRFIFVLVMVGILSACAEIKKPDEARASSLFSNAEVHYLVIPSNSNTDSSEVQASEIVCNHNRLGLLVNCNDSSGDRASSMEDAVKLAIRAIGLM